MSRHERDARSGADRTSLYDDITNKIIAELEARRVPWVQPWGTAAAKAPLAMPANAATGRQYSGINVLILWGAVIEHGFPVQSWLTFRQALSLGGHVRKGEHGTTVVYADRFIPDEEKRRAQETGEEAQAIPFLKRFAMRTKDGVATLSDLVRSSLRLRPDRIPIGEVRGAEALDLLKAWGAGHPGGIGTIHAGTAIGALRRLEQLIQEAVVTVPRALIAETIDLVAVLSGRGASRRLAELARVEDLGSSGDYRITPATAGTAGDHA